MPLTTILRSFDRSDNLSIWSFCLSREEQNKKKNEIANKAKNDAQDLLEVGKRNELNCLKMINKYLKEKMLSEVTKNKQIEETFQDIKMIAGIGTIEEMVEKIINKNNVYNTNVIAAAEKLERIDQLKYENKVLGQDLSKRVLYGSDLKRRI